jgi:hypothetical protein
MSSCTVAFGEHKRMEATAHEESFTVLGLMVRKHIRLIQGNTATTTL